MSNISEDSPEFLFVWNLHAASAERNWVIAEYTVIEMEPPELIHPDAQHWASSEGTHLKWTEGGWKAQFLLLELQQVE